MRILGIDPGLNRTGYGVIDVNGAALSLVEAGVIRVPKGELSERLAHIFQALRAVIEETRPELAACEKVFVNVNPQSTLLLGHARGAAICSAAFAGLHVCEFTPTEIKQAVTGTGRAAKPQIQAMMMRFFNLQELPQADAADALACALCAAQSRVLIQLAETDKTSIGKARASSHGGSRAARRAWTRMAEGMKGGVG